MYSSFASATPGYNTIESFDGLAFASAEGRWLMLALVFFCPPSSRTGKISSAFSYDILPVGCLGWSSSSTTEWSPLIGLSYELDAFGLVLKSIIVDDVVVELLVAAVIGIQRRALASLSLSLAVRAHASAYYRKKRKRGAFAPDFRAVKHHKADAIEKAGENFSTF